MPLLQGVGAASATILLVDDDPDILQLLTLTLRPEGYRLLSASDGNAALEIARAERPDLLLLDWNMPGRNGLEVCRVLRAEPDPELRDVPVVLLPRRWRQRTLRRDSRPGSPTT